METNSLSEDEGENAFEQSNLYKAVTVRSSETFDKVKEILKEDGTDVNFRCSDTGKGYLHVITEQFADFEDDSVEYKLVPVIYLLAESGIDVNQLDDAGNTCLHHAFAKNVGSKCVNAILKIGVDPSVSNMKGLKAGDYIKNETDPAMIHTLGLLCPGLWNAVESNNFDKVQHLVACWCRIDQERNGVSLLDCARRHANSDIVQLLDRNVEQNRFIYNALTGMTKRMKKQMKADEDESLDIDTKDSSHVENDKDTVPMPLVGEAIIMRQNEAVKLLLRKGSDVNTKMPDPATGNSDPLYFYLMKTYPGVVEDECFLKVLENADISQIIEFNVGVMYTAWKKKWPSEVVEMLLEKGFNLTKRSEDGYTVRDNILVHCFSAEFSKEDRKDALFWVDKHIIRLAKQGNLDGLEELAVDGYEHLNVQNTKGKRAAVIAKKAGYKEVADFLNNFQDFKRKARKLHKAIDNANLYGAREILDKKMSHVKDKGGRTPLHKAVLFDRRFIIRYLLKEYPETVNIKDDFNRTALHFACALPDSQDVEDMLLQAGANEAIRDVDGKTPMDLKISSQGEELIARERGKTCAEDIFCLERYLEFMNAIEEDDLDGAREARELLYDDIKLGDLTGTMFMKADQKPLELMEAVIDNGCQEIGKYLISEGIDIYKPVVLAGTSMTLIEACHKRHLKDLGDFIRKKKELEDQERMRLHEAENVVTGSTMSTESMAISMAPGCDESSDVIVNSQGGAHIQEQDIDGRKSSTCAIL